MPEGASIDEMVFVIFFMSPMQPLEWFGEYIHSNTEDVQRKIVYSALFVIVSTFIVVYLIVILITRKIIRAIIKLRYFSITMKQAYDSEGRLSIINQIAHDPQFRGVAREYEAFTVVSKAEAMKVHVDTMADDEDSDSDLDEDAIEKIE